MRHEYLLAIILILGCIEEAGNQSQKSDSATQTNGTEQNIAPDAGIVLKETIGQKMGGSRVMEKNPVAFHEVPEILGCQMMGPTNQYRIECLIIAAVKLADPDICNKIVEGPGKEACILFAKNDISICETMSGLNKTGCIMLYGQAKSDADACKRVEDVSLADDCYFKVAYAKRDKTLCEKIQDQQVKDVCFGKSAIIENHTASCALIENETLMNDCYMEISVRTGDPLTCDSIHGKIRHSSFKGFCYLDAAWKSKNESLCKKIDDKKIGTLCIAALQGDPDGCFESPYFMSIVDCIIKISIAESDPTMCLKLTGDPQWECIQRYAWSKQDPSICESVEPKDGNGPTRNSCILRISVDNLNPLLCRRMDFDILRDFCFWHIAARSGTPQFCNEIDDEILRDDCLLASS